MILIHNYLSYSSIMRFNACRVESHKEIGQEQISTARKEEVLLQGSMTVPTTEPVEQHKGAQPQNQPKITPNFFKLLAPTLMIIIIPHRTVLEIVQFHQTDETEQEIVTEAPQMHIGRVDSSHFRVGIEGQRQKHDNLEIGVIHEREPFLEARQGSGG